jgi:hypothetical protein
MSDSGIGAAFSALDRNISIVNDNLRIVNANIDRIDDKVSVVTQLQSDTRNELSQLSDSFAAFLAEYRRKTDWQLAQTKIVEVRQKLEKEFGYYDEVRRTATGLLQGADLGLVREDSARQKVEDILMSCPNYWLAPTLSALVNWLADLRDLAEKALVEALKRHDSKASLFFALVCRRARRNEASVRWLERYFQNQNPSAMQREVAVMLDAVVNGAFGGGALTAALAVIDGWLEELEEQPGFADEQRARWAEALDVMKPRVAATEYLTLRQYSPTWACLEGALSATRRNQVVYDFFEKLFSGETVMPPTLEATIDLILTALVTEFDEPELPLRRELTKLELVIAEKGDQDVADSRYASEVQALREVTNFGAILTNAAMYPERSGTTQATRRYAVSRSQGWIVAGFSDLVARDRAAIPQEAELKAGSWSGTSRDGTDEASLVGDCEQHYLKRIEDAVNAVKFEVRDWVLVGIGALLGLYFLSTNFVVVGLLIIVAAGAWGFFKFQGIEGRKLAARQEVERVRDTAIKILRASLAELTDLRRDLAREDAKAEEVIKLLESIHSSQFIVSGRSTARAVLN